MFKEALRLYGPVPATVKKAGPNGITLNGYRIPASTSLAVRNFFHYILLYRIDIINIYYTVVVYID